MRDRARRAKLAEHAGRSLAGQEKIGLEFTDSLEDHVRPPAYELRQGCIKRLRPIVTLRSFAMAGSLM